MNTELHCIKDTLWSNMVDSFIFKDLNEFFRLSIFSYIMYICTKWYRDQWFNFKTFAFTNYTIFQMPMQGIFGKHQQLAGH